MSNKDTIAWECPKCGHRHSWQWELHEASPGPVIMCCDECKAETPTELVRIGRYVWSAVWVSGWN
jgi:transcription elongation factor Elf1